MNESLGHVMHDLVADVDNRTQGPPDDLWRKGSHRRMRSRAAVAAVLAVVAGLVAFAAWPAVSPGPAVPATPAPVVTTARTYPSMIAHPYFAPDASTAHRPMVAVVRDGDTAYGIDQRGDAWRIRLPRFTPYAALSPNGRWVVDGRFVTDLVAGTRRPDPQAVALEELGPWAAWSPDSAHYATTTFPAGRVSVATPEGGRVPVPELVPYVRAGLDSPVAAGWVDSRTLLVAWTVPETTRLATFTWTIGARAWSAGPDLTLSDDVLLDQPSATETGVSPDGRTFVLTASARTAPTGRYETVLVSFDLPEGITQRMPTAGAVAGRVTALRTTSAVDGITWRGNELLVTVGGRTGTLGGAPLVTSGSGFTGQTSWRQDALVGDPYWNGAVVWRARLVVVAGVLLGVVAVWLLWRGALWATRRAGIIDGPLPYRVDLAWWRRV